MPPNLLSRVTRRIAAGLVPWMRPRQRLELMKSLGVTARLDVDFCDVRVEARSFHELERRPNYIEPETVSWLRGCVKDGDAVLDVGASVGTYALIAAKLYPRSTVYAVEPSFTNFGSLCRNIALNGLENRVFPICAALSGGSSIQQLSMPHVTPGPAGHRLAGSPRSGERPAVFNALVAVFSVDDFLARSGIGSVEHIKIDVDGLDLSVLKGAERTLSEGRVRSLCVETDEERESEMLSYLGGKGFRVLDNPRRAGGWNMTVVR